MFCVDANGHYACQQPYPNVFETNETKKKSIKIKLKRNETETGNCPIK